MSSARLAFEGASYTVQLGLVPGVLDEQPPNFTPQGFVLSYSLIKHAEKPIA